MKHKSPTLNLGVFLLLIAIGLYSQTTEVFSHIGFIVGFVFGILSIFISILYASRKTGMFRRPSLMRFPVFDWWKDPLQFYFTWTIFIFGLALSSMAFLAWGVLIGVVLAQIALFRFYRARLIQA